MNHNARSILFDTSETFGYCKGMGIFAMHTIFFVTIHSCYALTASINEEILQNQRAELGKQVVKNLSKKMTLEFGSGFNQINLWLFIRFVTFFPGC
jgi:hypothetical protein